MPTNSPGLQHPDPTLSAEEREFGMDSDITRRDFLNAVALGTGTAVLSAAAPSVVRALGMTEQATAATTCHPWTGYGGVGDYATSNGNTWEIVNAGHGIRDNLYEASIAGATPTGEAYDLVIVGGGFAGTIAAYTFLKETQRKRAVLLLDNHPIVGGEAKRNEFLVRGQRLIGPQGSNATSVPTEGWSGEMWRDVGLPTEFEFGRPPPGRRQMEFPLTDYIDVDRYQGYFFDTPRPRWVTSTDLGAHLENTPWPLEVRRDLLRSMNEPDPEFKGDEQARERWLDTMTYEDYLTKVRGLHSGAARLQDHMWAAAAGLGCDAISACLPLRMSQYGAADNAKSRKGPRTSPRFAFPGGNDGIMRAIVKWLSPEVIEGSTAFADIHNGRIRFDVMDNPGRPCRMRAGATVVRVTHDPESVSKGRPATITYIKDGRFYSVQARAVIWAAASWSGKHVIQRLPEEYREAMEGFPRAPMLVVNVALNNWRALYKLGYSSCRWYGGFGYRGNIRAPMYIGDYRPLLDPDHPALFTMYVPFPHIGLPAVEQGKVARAKLLGTSYREFELQIRQQLAKLFAGAGFDPKRDIAGIVLNRWGHAYAVPGPGFFYGRGGKPAPSDVLRRPIGNLTFAHTELAGLAAWDNAGGEGVRAAKQVLAMV